MTVSALLFEKRSVHTGKFHLHLQIGVAGKTNFFLNQFGKLSWIDFWINEDVEED
jgi:hypothetical protein